MALTGGIAKFSKTTESGGTNVSRVYNGSFLSLDFSLLGKLPVLLGRRENFAIYPLLGIGYNIMLSAMGDYGNVIRDMGYKTSDLNTFRIQFGLGTDFNITENIFLRASFLGAYRFAPHILRDLRVPGINTTGGLGMNAKIGIGYRF